MKNFRTIIKNRGYKPKKIKQKKDLGFFCIFGGNGGRLSKSTRFFC